MLTKSRIKQLARELGFDVCGIAPFEPDPKAEEKLGQWILEEKHGTMRYMENYEKRKTDFWKRFPDAKSIIVLGANYYSNVSWSSPNAFTEDPKPAGFPIEDFGNDNSSNDSTRFTQQQAVRSESETTKHDSRRLAGRIARFAWGKDYHPVLQERMTQLISALRSQIADTIWFEPAVDTKPLLERSYAQRAGLGFIGRQSHLISPRFGPWLFLCELVTNLSLEPDQPFEAGCANCRACIEACPTNAIGEDGSVDARKCVAYLTIEHKDDIPNALRPKVGNRLFGCDDCLESCPYGKSVPLSQWEQFQAEQGIGQEVELRVLSELGTKLDYQRFVNGSAMTRVSWKKLVLNALCVAENCQYSGSTKVTEKLGRLSVR